jgi:polyhydroxyalkanoate synthase
MRPSDSPGSPHPARTDLPGPFRRRGPRPLLMHLLGQTSATPPSATSSTGSPNLSAAWPRPLPFNPDPALIHGIAAYRSHPWRRTLADPPALLSEGAARLLDYGPPDGAPVLFIPSLVNRAYILDLMPGQSMMRFLAAHGIRPLLLDWGWPGESERAFTLTDCIAGLIERMLAALPARGVAEPVVLAGYCMGGLLALAAALRRPDRVRALTLLAAPWDFHADDEAAARRMGDGLPLLEPLLQATGALPVDTLQALFASLDPAGITTKFRHFGTLDQASDAAARFVALEDWLNDGVPLAAPVARETIGGWYGANTPARGEWRVAGQGIDPGQLDMPCFVAVPGRDRIVPPASALALAAMIPGAVVHRPASGHIGMAAGPRAEAGLWTPLLGWLRSL